MYKQPRAYNRKFTLPRYENRFTITLTENGPGQFASWNQVSSLGVLNWCLKWYEQFHARFIHKNYFEQFLSAHFLIWEVSNLNLTFAVCHVLNSKPREYSKQTVETPTMVAKINGKPRPPPPPKKKIKDEKRRVYALREVSSLTGGGGVGMGVCCSILFCPRL